MCATSVFEEQQQQPQKKKKKKKSRDAASWAVDDQLETEPSIPHIDLFLLVADLLILNK